MKISDVQLEIMRRYAKEHYLECMVEYDEDEDLCGALDDAYCEGYKQALKEREMQRKMARQETALDLLEEVFHYSLSHSHLCQDHKDRIKKLLESK